MDISDISKIAVFDELAGGYFYVPAVKFEYAKRKTMWQHKVIRRFQRERVREGERSVGLIEAESTIRSLIDSVSVRERGGVVRQRKSRFTRQGKGVGPTLNIELAEPCVEQDDTDKFYKSRKGWKGNYLSK